MKITHKKITASDYIPDMTERYPQGMRDIEYDPVLDGFDDDIPEYRFEVGMRFMYTDRNALEHFLTIESIQDNVAHVSIEYFWVDGRCVEHDDEFVIQKGNYSNYDGEYIVLPSGIYIFAKDCMNKKHNEKDIYSSEDIRKGMSLDDITKAVRDDFKKTMDEEGFDTFKEMRDSYDWEPHDIREEIDYIVRSLDTDWFMLDDGTLVNDSTGEEVRYRDFKKMVLDSLK